MRDCIERSLAIDELTERNLVVHMDSVNDGLVASCHRAAQRIIAGLPAVDLSNERAVVFCKDCRHRDPEDHKCDCGQLERAGCIFPVSDTYFCAYGEL